MANFHQAFSILRRKYFLLPSLSAILVGCTGLSFTDTKAAYDAELYRTEGGIPHIIAADWGSLGFGTGYAAAQDHFCQQSRNILKFRGQLAANFGPANGNLASDYFFKLLAKEGVYDESVDEEFEQLFAGYAAGFNRYLRDTGIDNVTDPVCGGAAWVTPMTAQDVRRFHLTPAFLPSFAPLILAAHPPQNSASSVSTIEQAKQLAMLDPGKGNQLKEYAASFYNPTDKGSNGVAIGRDLTGDESGLLFANPHLNWQDFDFRMYAMHQIIPGVSNLLGANQAQRAHVGFGTNGDVAWTNTVSTSKAYMFYKLDLMPGNSLAYHYDEEQRSIEPVEVTVDVRDDNGQVRSQSHTFYKAGDAFIVGGKFPWNSSMAVSLRIANEGARGFQGGALAMARAKNVTELKAAINHYQATPGINTVAVDSHGDVLYGDLGPMVNFTDRQMSSCQLYDGPLYQGNRSECAWNTAADAAAPGLLGAGRQASIIRSDYVTNSNDSYWLANAQAPIAGIQQVQGSRNSERTLRTRSGLAMVAAMAEQGDVNETTLTQTLLSNQNYAGQLLRDDVVAICRSQPTAVVQGQEVDLREACEVLAAWDLHDNLESRGAHLFREFIRAANDDKFTRWLPKAFSYRIPFDENDPVNTPRGLDRSNNPAVLPALAKAVLRVESSGIALNARLADIQSTTRAGERVALPGGEEFEGVFNKMAYGPIGKQGYPEVTGSSASWVMTTKLAPERTQVQGVVAYSESSDSSSLHYNDMTKMFANKQLIDIPYTVAEVKKAALSQRHLTEGVAQCAGGGWQFFARDERACERQFEVIKKNQLKSFVEK